MTKFRKPTKDEELDGWHHLAFKLHFHRTVTMNHREVARILEQIDAWVNAHSTANGERPEVEVKKNVNAAFWTNIIGKPELGASKRS